MSDLEKETSARDEAAAAFDALAGDSPDEPLESAPEPGHVDSAPEPHELEDSTPVNETPAEKAERTRDEAGRFAAKKAEAQVAKAVAKGAKPTAPVAGAELRAPNAMKPSEKEAFKAAPRELQEFLVRRDRDQAVTHQKLAENAKAGEGWSNLVAPYAPFIRSMGGDVRSTVDNLLRTGHVLQYGTPGQKAQAVHSVLTQFGVDLDLVNQLLDGKPVESRQGQAQQFDPNALAQSVRQSVMQELEAKSTERRIAVAHSEVDAFASTHPYLDEVREQMGELMDLAHKRGRQMDMERAYTLACQADPEISGQLAKQQPRVNAQVSPSRMRAASGSLRPRPSLPTGQPQPGEEKSARDTAAAAFDALVSR